MAALSGHNLAGGLVLIARATGLEPGQRYSFVWYGYRSDDDPAPVRYSFTGPPAPASGVLSVQTPFWGIWSYAQGDVLYRVKLLVVPAGRSDGDAIDCLLFDLYEPYNPEPCD